MGRRSSLATRARARATSTRADNRRRVGALVWFAGEYFIEDLARNIPVEGQAHVINSPFAVLEGTLRKESPLVGAQQQLFNGRVARWSARCACIGENLRFWRFLKVEEGAPLSPVLR
jgi:hypothetical protein